jgi:hypothetical protein
MFEIGQYVEWRSRFDIFVETKQGWVVSVVPVNQSPFAYVPEGLSFSGYTGAPKTEVSYLIVLGRTERKKDKKRNNVYWQPGSNLRLATEQVPMGKHTYAALMAEKQANDERQKEKS